MSLLLEEAERRFEARLALAQREAEAQLRQIQAKANVAEIELRVQTERALAQARLQVDEAERREQEACAEARAAEARADAARRQAEAERHRAEEMIACERQAKEVALQDMAERMERLQQDSDRRCRAMQEAVDRAKAEASHAVAECQRLTAGAQHRAERIAKKSQAEADDKTHAARAQSAAQTAQAQRLLAQCQAEAQERTEWALARAEAARAPLARRASESQLLKKLTNRISDFESQVASQIQTLTQDVDKKVSFMGSRRPGGEEVPGVESLARDVDAVKYDVGELKDLLNGAKHDTDHVKRIVLACERDMEDFTAAMDAVNVDLDEMRARVDSTHSIITSRQRVEATVTAEISTMRLDMGDMQEALKAHDAWMEDVSQSLQEAHERCQQIGLDINDVNQQMQVKLDAKTDIVSWNDMNDDIDASIRTVRDMASSLRFEVDNRRRRVDEELARLRSEMTSMDERVMAKTGDIQRQADEKHAAVSGRLEEGAQHRRELEATLGRHAETHNLIQGQINGQRDELDTRLGFLESSMKKQGEELQKSAHDRMDGMERHQSTIAKESGKHLNALDLRMAALQGASGESKRDINKIRDEVNSLTVKSAAHDVDIAKNSDDLRKLERQKAEDGQRQKQEFDAIYDELDQKVAEKSFQRLEDDASKLTRGVVKLCQVVGVFPGARMNDGTEEELDVDVEMLNWEDCAQNLTLRVEKTWRQLYSQKYRSILDLVGKKADHSVLRLLQISQQHIESQLDRVRHERELLKEVVERRAQQPMPFPMPMKDPNTGITMPQGLPGLPFNPAAGGFAHPMAFPGMVPDAGTAPGAEAPKPPAKRIARPPAVQGQAPSVKAAPTPRE
ncbi:Scn11a [Symbiodinium necroappetens]|uniref:Scn11a protein n=1 Tax=Symbiodinium necroappetens TaxID=1628268 RepID=A0A812S367_9DINO|nr:Scn11a [Symbiodinium necroappetens]